MGFDQIKKIQRLLGIINDPIYDGMTRTSDFPVMEPDDSSNDYSQPTHNRKFEVGYVYCHESFYCGGTVYNKVIERTEDTITIVETDWLSAIDSEDGEMHWRDAETYKVTKDEYGNEEVRFSEYSFINAGMPDGYNWLEDEEEA